MNLIRGAYPLRFISSIKVKYMKLQIAKTDSKCQKLMAGAKALNDINLDENLIGKNPKLTAKGAYSIASLTWILAYEEGDGRYTKLINKPSSDDSQDKTLSQGFVPLKGDIFEKSKTAVKKNW